jgi:hypothetical protein
MLSLLWLLVQSLVVAVCGFVAVVLLFTWFFNLATIPLNKATFGSFVVSSVLSWLLIIGYLLGLRRWWSYANTVWRAGDK